ncbi:MAG: nuclear transport factor 2 family protein [Proteobacteria bacterium]|nr:nuclear transport factor 2 family protein [Pseudomonadota bacterium]MBS0573765.1 nuclear transport factor 2 family protein [Pseudomonadota bacterium]
MNLLSEILSCEQAVWEALVKGDAAADHAMLAEEFLGVYPDGYGDRGGHAGQLASGPTVAAYELCEVRILAVGPDTAMLVYKARYRRTGRGAEEAMYVSSLWQRRNGRWLNLFSQDTPAAGIAVP